MLGCFCDWIVCFLTWLWTECKTTYNHCILRQLPLQSSGECNGGCWTVPVSSTGIRVKFGNPQYILLTLTEWMSFFYISAVSLNNFIKQWTDLNQKFRTFLSWLLFEDESHSWFILLKTKLSVLQFCVEVRFGNNWESITNLNKKLQYFQSADFFKISFYLKKSPEPHREH